MSNADKPTAPYESGWDDTDLSSWDAATSHTDDLKNMETVWNGTRSRNGQYLMLKPVPKPAAPKPPPPVESRREVPTGPIERAPAKPRTTPSTRNASKPTPEKPQDIRATRKHATPRLTRRAQSGRTPAQMTPGQARLVRTMAKNGKAVETIAAEYGMPVDTIAAIAAAVTNITERPARHHRNTSA